MAAAIVNEEIKVDQDETIANAALEESLAPWTVGAKDSKVKMAVSEHRTGTQSLIDYINGLNIDNNQKPLVLNQALGFYTATQKNIHKQMDIKLKEDVYKERKLSSYPITLTATTVDDCIGNTGPDGAFFKQQFESEFHKQSLKSALIDIALFRLALEPLPAGDPGIPNRNTLKTALLTEKANINYMILIRNHEQEISNKVKMNMAQTNSILTSSNSHLVVCPSTGTNPHPSAEVKQTLTKLVQNTPFGSGSSRPLKEYLTLLTSVIAGYA